MKVTGYTFGALASYYLAPLIRTQIMLSIKHLACEAASKQLACSYHAKLFGDISEQKQECFIFFSIKSTAILLLKH